MKEEAIIYARFSSHSQTEQSIEGQLRECYDFAKRADFIVVAEYIDRALTGTTDKRPEFLRMIEDSKKRNWKYVIVYQLDRFARNRYDSAIYKAKLKKNGVRVLSAKENITEDASGILVEGMLESMAEYYSAELSQKVRRGIRESLLKGNFIGGYGLFGYDVVDKKWAVNQNEADIVKDMFVRYKNGEKAKEIIERVNNTGAKTKRKTKFNMHSFARLIRNEKYIGKIVSGDKTYYDIIPQIVEERLFKECNLIMDEHKHKQRQVEEKKLYILSGKLKCGYCNSFMTAETGTSETGRVYHYYKCFNKKLNKRQCFKKNYSQQELEDLVFNTTVEYVLQPEIIEAISKLVVEKFNSEISKTGAFTALEKELKEKGKAINAIMSAIEKGIITKTTQSRLMELEREKEEIEDKLYVEKSRQIKPLQADEVKAFLNLFARKQYDVDDEKKDFFNKFINRVILYDDKLLIFYNTSPDSQSEVKLSEQKGLITFKDNKKCNSFDLEFKRVARGGEGEI